MINVIDLAVSNQGFVVKTLNYVLRCLNHNGNILQSLFCRCARSHLHRMVGEVNRKFLKSMAKRNIIGLQHSDNTYSAVELEWFAVLIRCYTGRKMTAAQAISYLVVS